MRENKKLQLYIHIPFCVKKCNYCDFLSAPCSKEQQEAYMEALFLEIRGRAEAYGDHTVCSVFIGGGTPSVVDAGHIAEVLSLIKTYYTLSSDAEITIEVNPGTVNEEKLGVYYRAGINRLSIGLQSAGDLELQKLGRVHTYEQFLDTYIWARKAGFSNINVDVMSALPGQSPDSYRDTLYRLLKLSPIPEHISAYSLIVEEGTPFARWAEEGRLDLPDEDCERDMYEETKRILGEAGFHRYEISNYAREGYECRHNCGYWKRTEYVGFGIGAASLVGESRFTNDSNLAKYIESPLECRSNMQELSIKEQMEETMFLGLRMTAGISADEFLETYGQTLEEVYGEVVSKNIQDGLLEFADDRHLRLTERGLDISNYVMSQFLFDEQ